MKKEHWRKLTRNKQEVLCFTNLLAKRRHMVVDG